MVDTPKFIDEAEKKAYETNTLSGVDIVTQDDEFLDPEGWAEANYHSFIISILADMDASDTAYGNVYQAGGTNTQTDIIADSNGTYFSGYLVA